MFTWGLLLGGTSGTTKVPEEAMEVVALVLEMMVTEKEMESSVLDLEVVAGEKEVESSIPVLEFVAAYREIEPSAPVSETLALEVDILGQEDTWIPLAEPAILD